MRISIIAAVADNGVIGRAGTLPWHLPDDLKRFKRITKGHTVVMGRKTFESLPGPLPDRRLIVLTRRPNWHPDGAQLARTLDDAIALARRAGETELFIIGGAKVFAESLPRADRLYLTQVHATIEGDTCFPEYDASRWTLLEEEHHSPDDRHAHAYTFRTLRATRGVPA